MLKEGDVIEQVKIKGSDFMPVDNVDAFTKNVQGVKEGDAIMYLLFRDGNSFYVAYKVQK